MQMNKVDSDHDPSLINLLKIKDFTATSLFGIASNYIWRGITQSNEKIAASGGLDFSSTSGFYVGAWASTLSSGSYELDLYKGYIA